ncbi:MAG TPA: hypothetical protein VK438_07000 [Xanthobacteraceae bacterium]|nr:hypothetical protein [Xanthobacteraceae bacterium]
MEHTIDPAFATADDATKFRWLYRAFENLERKALSQEATIRALEARLAKVEASRGAS